MHEPGDGRTLSEVEVMNLSETKSDSKVKKWQTRKLDIFKTSDSVTDSDKLPGQGFMDKIRGIKRSTKLGQF